MKPEMATFGLPSSFVLLKRTLEDSDRIRCYAEPLAIREEEYYLCSQWDEDKSRVERP